jgi:hypothetical protein
VPSVLKSRIALFVMMGTFLIPIGMSSLRGLTHVLTCREEVKTPFTLIIPEQGRPQISSSQRITPGDTGLCGGLALDLRAGGAGSNKVLITVIINNRTEDLWKGTVSLNVEGVGVIPVNIGSIGPGGTASDQLPLKLKPGSHELGGSLLIGP